MLFTYGLSGVLTAIFDDREYTKKSYFHTTQYEDTVGQLLAYIQAFEQSYQPKEEMKKLITVSNEEIEEYRFRYGDLTEQLSSIEDQYAAEIEEAIANDSQNLADIYKNERDKKIEDITKNFESDEYVKQKIVKEKEQRVDEYYKELEGYLEDFSEYKEAFAYYLKDTKTGEVYTNLPSKDSKSVDKYINDKDMLFIQKYPTKNQSYLGMKEQPFIMGYEDVINHANSNALFEGEIAISKESNNTNFIIANYYEYNHNRIVFFIYAITAIIAFIVSIMIGKKIKVISKIAPQEWINLYHKIPIDIAFILFGITALISLALFADNPYIYNFSLDRIIFQLIIMTIFIWFTMIQGIYLYPRLKLMRTDKEVWRSSFAVSVIKMLRNAFINRRVGTQVFLILAIVFLFGVGTILIIVEPLFLIGYVPALLLIGLPLFIIIVKRIGYFNQIIRNTNALAKGHFEPDLKIIGKSIFAKLAEDINTMKHGVKTSKKEQAKSEKLKTELITNVSHDLRTPLTSIITYSELLKNPELHEDERNSYIEIIDRKSKRLKVLIDDLFEASKMASGNIELSKAKVDIIQLLQQALAEYNETIQSSHIQFRVAKPEKSVYAFVDGQKLWRVFDNLIGNILKYSLENTRAYINVKEENGQTIITFKNVSKYELSDDVDELFERFKRGDESRHTDGSGLGLAIAKSIIDLHDGSLDIDVDGDLFKVTIMLDLLSE
jgi:signal transduction histidine kinase